MLAEEYSDSQRPLSKDRPVSKQNFGVHSTEESPFVQHLKFHTLIMNSKAQESQEQGRNQYHTPFGVNEDERRAKMKQFTQNQNLEFEDLELRERGDFEDLKNLRDMNSHLRG